MTAYQVSSEIYGGFFHPGITLIDAQGYCSDKGCGFIVVIFSLNNFLSD